MRKIPILQIALIIISICFLSGCNEETTVQSNPMKIYHFYVTSMLIESGETANLNWNVTGATTVSIDNNIGTVGLNGSIIIQPTKNTTYTLTSKNSTDTLTATAEIIVLDLTPIGDIPEISWIYNDVNNTITVDSISESGLSWDNIQITGTANKPTGFIEIGDSIAECFGTITVSWKDTTLLGTWTFTEDTTKDAPVINFFMDDEGNYLFVMSVSESGLDWDNIQITGTANKPTGIIEAGDFFTECYGTITVSWQGKSSLGTWFFSEKNGTMPDISFAKTSKRITVFMANSGLDWNDFEVIYDGLTLVLLNAETGTTLSSGNVVASDGTMIYEGDYIYVEGDGTLRLRHKPTNLIIGIWKFT